VPVALRDELHGHLQSLGPGGQLAGVSGISPDQPDAAAGAVQVPQQRPVGVAVLDGGGKLMSSRVSCYVSRAVSFWRVVLRRAIVGLWVGEGRSQVLAEGLMSLASLAGQTVVKAATTDTWDAAKRGIARLLGRGDPKQEQLAERRLEETRGQLAGIEGTDLEQARSSLAAQWATRLADLLDVNPGAEADLRALVQRIQKELPAVIVSADDHAVAAGRDVNIQADHGAVAAGVIQGTVAPPNPTRPGPATK